jgi:hypothetical protein
VLAALGEQVTHGGQADQTRYLAQLPQQAAVAGEELIITKDYQAGLEEDQELPIRAALEQPTKVMLAETELLAILILVAGAQVALVGMLQFKTEEDRKSVV